jgi:hypothetical protein
VTASAPGPGAGPADPDGAAPGIPGALPPDRDDLDVRSLAGLAPPADGDWLLVTSVEVLPGSEFTAQHLHRRELRARGGDVLVRVAPDAGPAGQRRVRAQVWAVAGGRLLLAGNWDKLNPVSWADQVRPTVAFVMGILTELEESGADLGSSRTVWLDDPDVATVGVPFGITTGPAAGPGRPPA